MSPLLLLLAVALSALASLVAAAPTPRSAPQWFTVEWDAPEFTAMSGDFAIPNVPAGAKGGIPYVWPGLQSDNGVLQAELNGQSGSWTLGTSFYGAPSLPLGSRFAVSPGQTVHFSFTRTSSNVWTCTLSGPGSTTHTFNVPGNTMNRAILAVDLTDVPHDFDVSYSNVVITAAASQAEHWCATSWSRGYGSGGYTVKDAVADGTTCRIGSVVLPRTA